MTQCELCDRDKELTSHHLIPKQTHSKSYALGLHTKEEMKFNRAMLCRLCHREIHRFFTHKELATLYYTVEMLKNNETVNKFLVWARKQK